MNKLIKSLAVILSLAVLAACKNDASKSDESTPKYVYNHEATTMEWTAFKFESKAPVKGTFTNIAITSLTDAPDMHNMVKSLGFTIPVNSIETLDDSRNAKIIEFFFGVMNTKELTGNVLDLKQDGTIALEITMHGITDKVYGKYTIKDNLFSFHATMDLTKWNTSKAIEVLNENCKVNHTENGVTKVWSEVDLSFTTKFDVIKK